MSFSYGYHHCRGNAGLNCVQARIRPERATIDNALKELRATAKEIDETIATLEKEKTKGTKTPAKRTRRS